MANSLWSIAIIVGPILLAAVILWAILNNRTTPEQDAQTEAATHRLYDAEDREDKLRDNL